MASKQFYDREYAALVTPYKRDSLEIDYDQLRGLVRYFTKDPKFLQVRGSFIVNPEAGEIYYLSREERRKIVEVVVAEREGGVLFFAGAYGATLEEAITSALDAKAAGADGLFVFPPVGNWEVCQGIDGAANPEIWHDWVKAIDEACSMPMIIHAAHVHSETWGYGVPLPSVKMMMEGIPNIVGYKMVYFSPGPAAAVAKYLRSLPRHVSILNADTFTFPAMHMLGLVDGTVSGGWNWGKEVMQDYQIAWDKWDVLEAKKILNEQLAPMNGAVYTDLTRMHIFYKLGCWIRGRCAHPFMRPPMPPPRLAEAENMYNIFEKAGVSVISREEFQATLARKDEILATYKQRIAAVMGK